MKLTQVSPADRKVIEGYRAQTTRVSGEDFTGPVAVFPTEVVPFPFESYDSLTESSFEAVIARAADVRILLFGSGDRARILPAPVRAFLGQHGIVPESMDCGAACRTYNVLLAEGRLVAAVIIPA